MAYSGAGGVWAAKDGDFIWTPFPGTGAGFNSAFAYISGVGGQILVGPGTYTGVQIVWPAANRIRIRGAGAGSAILKGTGSASVITLAHSHLGSEWFSAIEGVKIDGNGASQAIVDLYNATLFTMRDVWITNGSGIGLKLKSIYDSHFDNIYVENCGSGAGSPMVVLDADTVASNAMNNCHFYNLHIETDTRDTMLLDIIGNATNAVEENYFFGLKAHGAPSNSNPSTPVVRLQQYAKAHVFDGGIVAFGRGTSQLEVTGDRNRFRDLNFGVGGTPPANAVEFIGGRNYLIRPNFKSNTYTNRYVKNSGQYCHLEEPIYGTGGPALFVDTGFLTAVYKDPAGVGTHRTDNRGWLDESVNRVLFNKVTLVDAATIAVDSQAGSYFTVTLGGNRTMGSPTNAIAGQLITYEIIQDGTGTRTLAFSGIYKHAWSDIGNIANKRSTITFRYNGTNFVQEGAQSPYMT